MIQARKLPAIDFSMAFETVNFEEEKLKIFHYLYINLSSDANEKYRESVKRVFMTADRGCAVENLLKEAGTQTI